MQTPRRRLCAGYTRLPRTFRAAHYRLTDFVRTRVVLRVCVLCCVLCCAVLFSR